MAYCEKPNRRRRRIKQVLRVDSRQSVNVKMAGLPWLRKMFGHKGRHDVARNGVKNHHRSHTRIQAAHSQARVAQHDQQGENESEGAHGFWRGSVQNDWYDKISKGRGFEHCCSSSGRERQSACMARFDFLCHCHRALWLFGNHAFLALARRSGSRQFDSKISNVQSHAPSSGLGRF